MAQLSRCGGNGLSAPFSICSLSSSAAGQPEGAQLEAVYFFVKRVSLNQSHAILPVTAFTVRAEQWLQRSSLRETLLTIPPKSQ